MQTHPDEDPHAVLRSHLPGSRFNGSPLCHMGNLMSWFSFHTLIGCVGLFMGNSDAEVLLLLFYRLC